MKQSHKEFHKRLGDVKTKDLIGRSNSLYDFFRSGERHKGISGVVREAIIMEFITEYLAPEFSVARGLVYYDYDGTYSPEIDAIIYQNAPLMTFGNVVIVDNKQVKLLIEVKSWTDTTQLFGEKNEKTGKRNKQTGLWKAYEDRKRFGSYVLVIFSLLVGPKEDTEVWKRLEEVSDLPVILSRKIGRNEQLNVKGTMSNFIWVLQNLNKNSPPRLGYYK